MRLSASVPLTAILGLLVTTFLGGCADSSPKPKGDEEGKTSSSDKPMESADERNTRLLLGKWDGMQLKKNAHGTTHLTGVLTLAEAGNLKFNGKSGFQQVVAFGTWKVQDGMLTYLIEGSNIEREIPNGTTGAVKIREIDDNEFLYIDLNDQRTYSAKRLSNEPGKGEPAKGGKGK